MSRPLILLLGHENSENGELSAIAISRCATAYRLTQEHPTAAVLCTGSYGAHFNTTDRPHHLYLANHLASIGVEQERILHGTNSSNTLEDSLCARKEIVDGEYSPVYVVTSDYHHARVDFILSQVFRKIDFTICDATTPTQEIALEEHKESRSFAWLRKNWVSPPIYQSESVFPDSVYSASSDDQKHYDTVSLTAVTSAVIVSGLLLQPTIETAAAFANISKLLLGFIVDLVLLIIYERCAAAARVARRSMRLMEIAFDHRGFSSNYDPHLLFRSLPSIQTAVRYLFGVLLLIHVALTMLFWLGVKA